MKRRIIVIALLIGALTLLSPTRPQRAACVLPACSSEREFYSDGSFTTVVGDYFVSCNGVIRSGHSSCYYMHYEYGTCGSAECSDLEFTCTNGTITAASNPAYVGQSCGCVPVF